MRRVYLSQKNLEGAPSFRAFCERVGSGLVGTGRFDAAERCYAAPLARLLFCASAALLRFKIGVLVGRQPAVSSTRILNFSSCKRCWSGRADLTRPNAATQLPSQVFSSAHPLRSCALRLGCIVGRQTDCVLRDTIFFEGRK
jgi:hypothetical protein